MKLDAASEKKLARVKAPLGKLARRAAEISPHSFAIVQGLRTKAEQAALYANGRTVQKNRKPVTWTMNSRHISGNAIDFAVLVKGKTSWNAALYPPVVKAFKQAAAELKIKII